jgi:phosphopantetheinyl transferase
MPDIFHIDNATIAIEQNVPSSDVLLQSLDHRERYQAEIANMPEHRRREWLSARLLLKQLTGKEREICYQPDGKPFLADRSFNISISHSRGTVAVAVDPVREIAIDIEKITPRVENVMRRFMSKSETAAVCHDCKLLHVLIHWTVKEAVFKIMNCEDVDFRRDIHVEAFRPVAAGWSELTAVQTCVEPACRYRVRYLVTENFVVSVIQA